MASCGAFPHGGSDPARGLTVNATLDERLDLQKETAPAIGLLSYDHARYGDWGLALAAYNQGERAVDRAISEGASRDALVLAEAGLLNDYVAQVYAAAILMNSPTANRRSGRRSAR